MARQNYTHWIQCSREGYTQTETKHNLLKNRIVDKYDQVAQNTNMNAYLNTLEKKIDNLK